MSAENEPREIAIQIAHRLIDEPEFRVQVRDDPTGALTAAGLPSEGVQDFLREWRSGMGDEVEGYYGCNITCTLTCMPISITTL